MALFDEIGSSMLRRHEGGREIALGLVGGVRALRQRFRHIFGRLKGRAALAPLPRPPTVQPSADSAPGDRLAGPSFTAQEPDLAKEAGPNGRQMSGWAMADPGQPT